MPELLNFDTVRCDYVDIVKTPAGEQQPREYHLRDDVPAELMLRAFALQDIAERLQRTVREQDAQGIENAWDAYSEKVLHLCGDIFRHSRPEVADDDLRRVFTHDEREQIVQLFFSRRSAGWKRQQPATPAAEQSTAVAELRAPNQPNQPPYYQQHQRPRRQHR